MSYVFRFLLKVILGYLFVQLTFFFFYKIAFVILLFFLLLEFGDVLLQYALPFILIFPYLML